MKIRFLLFGLIFAVMALSSRAQITETYSQNFETGTPVTYSTSGITSVQSSIISGGSKAMMLTPRQNDTSRIVLDTVDFTANATWNYFTLEFMHIAYYDATHCSFRASPCIILVKRPGQAAWTQLNSTHYHHMVRGEFSEEFMSMGSFSKQSYADWDGTSTVGNTLWKAERFDLEAILGPVAPADRKLIVAFVVNKANRAATNGSGWYIDDIHMRASSQQIITPTLQMRAFPDALKYPSSRGAKLIAEVTTTVTEGINQDSVFAEYRVGNSTHVQRTYLHRVPGTVRFEGRIPFYGYDTLMHYHIVAKDSTRNNNTAYYPKNSSQWLTYKCVRGRTNSGQPTGTQSNVSALPFINYGDNRSEFIYDSVTMAEMGFGPGYITNFRFIVATQPRDVTRPHLQYRLANAPYSQVRTNTMLTFTPNMQVMYDSSFTIEQAAPNSYKSVMLQDTFFYAGSDLVMQVVYDDNNTGVDPAATAVKHISTAANKHSLYLAGHEAALGYNAFDNPNFDAGDVTTTRPWVQFYETQNVPLIYDCGISSLAYPSYTTPCNIGTDSVVVWLKNFGASPMTGIRIAYRVDNRAPVYYDWTGSLNGGDSVRVMVNPSETFSVGYHTMHAWVEDTMTVDSLRVRDHEPYNDSCYSPFTACDGPYSGVRTVGTGASANFTSLENCLYALSRCGIDAPLTIKLPAGTYDVTKFPYIPGTSETNYVLFEPATASAQVTFRRSRHGVTTNASSLVDLSEAAGIRFRNIRFSNGMFGDNRCNVLVQMGEVSARCQFIECTFVDSNTVNNSAQALIQTGEADSLLVTNCTFYGGIIGVDVSGLSPEDRATGNTIQFNDFAHQVNTAISVVNQSGVWVDSNFVNDVQTNASYIILGQYIYDGSRITRNRVFSSTGSSCIGVSDMHGTSDNYCIIANNMLVSLDDGTSNMLTTPLNVIQGSYIKAVFNSVRMNAPTRVNVAAATFGGGLISNSYFQNNVIATFDTSNYAFSFIPGNNASTLHVDHNCYYSVSGVLNKYGGSTNYSNLNQWRMAVPGDLGSVVGNPNYTNGSVCRVDLRSFNALLRNVGTPVPEVTIDLFGSTRDAAAPSLGAYEVVPLSIDFTPVAFVTPLEDYCGAPSSIPVEVCVRNVGNGTYTYSASHPINISYSIDNGPVQTFTCTANCRPYDTLLYLSTRTMSLPSGAGNTDRTYNIRWWVKCNLDPNDLNDTGTYTVLSRYAAPAPTVINTNVAYNTAATITPTAGINTWPVSYYTNASYGRQQRSGISWYHSMDDTACFYYGPTLVTDPLFDDTTFYISQKRNLPLVKITEVQVNRTATGATNPLPNYMNTSTAFAVELTNCGDYPANLEGDSIIVVQTSGTPKIWVLPNVTIQPGANLLLQFKAMTTPSDSTRTIYAPSTAVVTPGYTTNFGIIYRDGHGVADAVPFNSITTSANWTSQGIPTGIWAGSSINLAQGGCLVTPPVNTATAGARRISWPTNAATASPTGAPTANQWQVATAANPMHIGETEANLIRYFDNGCEGYRSAVNVHVTNVPSIDIAVDEPVIDTGCNLTSNEPIMVTIHNYGASSVSAGTVTVKCSLDGGATVACTDVITSALAPRSSLVHTFSTTLNMHQPVDTTFNVKVWVNSVTGDAIHSNDTSRGSYIAHYTPETPIVTSPQNVNYDDNLTLTAGGLAGKALAAWYDADHNPLDTTSGSYVTPNIYHPDTFYVKAIALVDVPNTHVGTLASATVNNYPSPYNPKTRYVKEQYIFTPDEIRDAGHEAGTITSLSFFLESMGANVNSFTYSYFTIKMGNTTNATFANANFINTGLSQVYTANNLTLTSNDLGWVHHKLNTPFTWNGTSNIVIEITRALNAVGPTNGANTRYTAKANSVITKQNASSDQATQTLGTKGGNRPDIIFGFNEPAGCESAEAEILIDVVGVPNVDASIVWPASLDTMVVASCDTTHLDVVLKNMGHNAINNYTLRYKIDNNSWQQTTGNANNLGLGYNRTVPLLSTHLTPGRHTITAVVKVTGDSVLSNDTISRSFNVRFCEGTYVIGNCTGHDYTTLTTAIDTLHNAGVAGPVTFELCPQTFNEQIVINNIPGASFDNTVTFKTVSGSTEMATIKTAPTNANNYVVYMNGANYVTFDSIYIYGNYTSGSGNNIYANALRIDGSTNIAFRNCVLRSKKTTASSTNANVVLLGSENHYVTIDNCVIDSGYYGVRSYMNVHSDNINITNNDITNFWYQGVYLRACDTVKVNDDSIASGVTVAGKPLTGIYISDAKHAAVQRNFVFLVDDKTGGKRGIQLNHCTGTNIDRVTVYNNMIATSGSAVASLSSSGIWIDSLSKYVNVLFNTAYLYAGANQAATRTFSVQNSSQIHALNNIFRNESKGFAAYIAIDTCMASSNFNVYWSNADTTATGARKFVKWGTPECQNLDTLRRVNGKDVNSMEEFPYFVREPYDLRCALAQFAGLAQYNPDVTTDVFGTIRPQIPAPTIGSHEFGRTTHNLTVAEILSPMMPTVTTGNNAEVYNIETDSILVRARFYNNGNGPENNVTWYAYMLDANPPVISETRSLGRVPLRTMVEDSVKIASPLGIVDEQQVVVVINTAPGVVDADTLDNRDTANMFIYPAYNLQLVSVTVLDTVDTLLHPRHCRMYAMPIKYKIKNVGYKEFPASFQFNLGYDYYCQTPTGASFPNIPGYSSDDVANFSRNLPQGTEEDVVNHAPFWPNLYPTGNNHIDATLKFRGFINFQYDVKPLNDTTNYQNVTTNHTPDPPEVHDTMVDYGSYGNLYATQNESRVIRWYRNPADTIPTTSDAFFYNGNNNYNRSTHWSNTPQYFHDSVYYLNAWSNKNCPSYYVPINVGINPPLYCDVSISEVRSPRASGRVYLENDTVTLRVVNYGSGPVSNIPIAFKFMNANGRTTYLEVHDTVRHTFRGRVGDDVDYFDYTFDTALLAINQPLTGVTYTLNAWVYHPNDQQRGNDTLRTVHTFRSLPESTYAANNEDGYAPTAPEGFDITRVSYYTLDNVMPDMIGYTNLVLGAYNESNAETPHLVVRRGTVDTLTVEVANNQDEMDSTSEACLMVAIDYNRDGIFDTAGVENLCFDSMMTSSGRVPIYSKVVHSRREVKIPLTIDERAHYGYMRMLVWVKAGDTTVLKEQSLRTGSNENGQMQQYLLYVTEDKWLDSFNVALTRVVTPHRHIVTENDHKISFMMANTGLAPLTNATINYHLYNGANGNQNGTINWTGNLEAGKSELITIDTIDFYEGTSDFVAAVYLPSDTDTAFYRPTLNYQYHRWYVVEPRFIDSFDQDISKWYIPAGTNNFTRNYFERSTPAKSHISSAYSSPNAMVTSATQTITTGKYGNRSVLYMPRINISQIRTDTISFLMAKDLTNGSSLTLEYLDWTGHWVRLDDPNAHPGADVEDDPSWYDGELGWTGSSSNGAYNTYQLSTQGVSGNFDQNVQFRFVYKTPVEASASASFGDGAAIDNFKLGRAQRDQDLGVTAIVYPTDPQFGQSIKPRVTIHNYGRDSITDFIVGYIPFGTYLAHEAICSQVIHSGEDIEFEFPDPFIITSEFPDTFQICAFTRVAGDIYSDNDSVCALFGLSPLANDLYMYDILSPLDNCTAGDSLTFTVRLRNFGQNEIEDCDVHLIFNEGDTITEHINFAELIGHPLGSTEFFNYTFHKKYRATYGTMFMTTWCSYGLDVYPYNDSISKRIMGIGNIIDMQATAAMVDERDHNVVYICAVLDNVGSYACNDFRAGYWYDNDPSTRFEEVVHYTHGIPAHGHTVYRFSQFADSVRSNEWKYVTVYVAVDGDNNQLNDTSTIIDPGYDEMSIDKVQVEENMTDSCRVRAQITNNGTLPFVGNYTVKVRVNGVDLKRNVSANELTFDPGQTRYVVLQNSRGVELKVPKSPTREYTGTGNIQIPSGDENPANDQTSIVEVINYFESVPLIDNPDFALEQNYPNPYDAKTSVEFAIPNSGNVRFFVSDMIGRRVYEKEASYAEGRHTITFDRGSLAAGVYYYGIEFGGERRMNKMIIK